MKAVFILLAVSVGVASALIDPMKADEYHRIMNSLATREKDLADCKNSNDPWWIKHCTKENTRDIAPYRQQLKKFKPEDIAYFQRLDIYKKALNQMRAYKRADCAKKIVDIALKMGPQKGQEKAFEEMKKMGEKELSDWHTWNYFLFHVPGGVHSGWTAFIWCDLHHAA